MPLFFGDSPSAFRRAGVARRAWLAALLVAIGAGADGAVRFTHSNLPIMAIDTHGARIPDEPKIAAHMGLVHNGPGRRNRVTDAFNAYDGPIGIELRGHSTISVHWPKKGYGIETRQADGTAKDVALLGMPPENDWVLHGPLMDKSLMRNVLLHRLFREMGHYAPRTQWLELTVNGEYRGVYVLLEKLEQDPNRVRIAAPAAEPEACGYLLEMTLRNRVKKRPGEPFFRAPVTGKPIVIKDPDPDMLTAPQSEYIAGYYAAFEHALFGARFRDPVVGYRAYIELDAWVDHIIVSEAFGQLDAFVCSQYMHKDKGGKLVLGPTWDFNRCIGNAKYATCWKTDAFWLLNPWSGKRAPYLRRFMQDEFFMNRMNARWQALRAGPFSFVSLFRMIDEYAEVLREASGRDFERWPIGVRCHNVRVCNRSFEAELAYMKRWIRAKFKWLDTQLAARAVP